MRTLHFQQITDSRFESDILHTLLERNKKIKRLLSIEGIENLRIDNPRKLDFGDCIQYRSDFYIIKNNKIKWDTIYGIVNNVKAVPYKFI